MQTLRKLALIALAVFTAFTYTSCNDDDDPVVNATLEGTWSIVEGTTTGKGDFELIPEGFTENPQTGTVDKQIYPVSLNFNSDGSGIYTYTVIEYTVVDQDGTEIVESNYSEKTSAFTYSLADESQSETVKNSLPQMTINYAASPYFESTTQVASYRIEGEFLYLYHDFPRAADILRKK